MDRHPEADTTPTTVERSDAMDAAGALLLMARKYRKDASSRRNAGANLAGYRASLRGSAKVYEAAARRVQRAADAAGGF
jgi:hypothetical protein